MKNICKTKAFQVTAFLLAFALVNFVVIQVAGAGSCADVGGDCYEPGHANTGAIGTTTKPFGQGNFKANTLAAPRLRSFEIPLLSLYISEIGLIGADGTTAPGLASPESIPKVIWASGETASVGYTFTLPGDYSTALAFRLMATSSANNTVLLWGFDWNMWVNKATTAYDAAPFNQAIGLTTETSPESRNAAITLTADATALAGLAAGDTVTVYFWPKDTRFDGVATGTTELISIQARYTAVQ